MNFDPRFAWVSAGKDLRRRMRDPLALLLWIGIPLVIGGLISFASGGGGKSRPTGKILVCDLDDSLASRGLAAAFDQGELGSMFEVEQVELDDGRARMREGDATALIVVPLGFGEALLLDRPTRLELIKNPAYRILPRIVEEALGLLADANFYAQRMAGDRLRGQLETILHGPPPDQHVMSAAFVAGFSVEINNTVERLMRYIDPLAIEVELESAGEDAKATAATDGPRASIALWFFPSMLFLSLMFMAQGLSEDLWREKSAGTLRRVNTTSGGIESWLAGKFLAAAGMFTIVAACGLCFAVLALRADPLRALAALPWATLSGALLFSAMILLQMYAKSQRGGDLITNSVLFPLSMMGGAFFPFEVMPEWMQTIGKRLPNGFALAEFKRLLSGEVDVGVLALGGMALVLCSLVLFLLARRRLLRVFLLA